MRFEFQFPPINSLQKLLRGNANTSTMVLCGPNLWEIPGTTCSFIQVHMIPQSSTCTYFIGPPTHKTASTFASVCGLSTLMYQSTILLKCCYHRPQVSMSSSVNPFVFDHDSAYFRRLGFPISVSSPERDIAQKCVRQRTERRTDW
jgi:hypothetical protein